jgi:hypothetical protein
VLAAQSKVISNAGSVWEAFSGTTAALREYFDPPGQAIALDNDIPLSSDAAGAMEGLASMFEHQRPVVFLNACEVGREEVGLTGVGGFPAAFIDLGASAVIGALWSVKTPSPMRLPESFTPKSEIT